MIQVGLELGQAGQAFTRGYFHNHELAEGTYKDRTRTLGVEKCIDIIPGLRKLLIEG